jgi:hypothetical protein
VAAHADQIELEFVPGYTPELNPTELLNQNVKTNALGRRRPRSQHELIGDTRTYLSLHATPPRHRRPLLQRQTRQRRQSSMTAIYQLGVVDQLRREYLC